MIYAWRCEWKLYEKRKKSVPWSGVISQNTSLLSLKKFSCIPLLKKYLDDGLNCSLSLLSLWVSTSATQFVCSNITYNFLAPSSHYSHLLCKECDQMPYSHDDRGKGRCTVSWVCIAIYRYLWSKPEVRRGEERRGKAEI